ncbi:MAG: hypothetical protein M0R46_16575 [Candidatus Muirbacterium halophilum]|nr:hypothetical protein [Candidatus Muirbacterium halophilum]MCK9477533.1 hypothetical protein [Candidatus Muirbacterium halophilum]
MIEKFIEEKLLYRKGKSIFVNQTNISDFLQNSNISSDIKIQLLEHIRIIEDYNAVNVFFKNFDSFSNEIQQHIINVISIIPFSKIEQIIIRLVNHRDILVRITVIKTLRHFRNFELLEIIFPQITGGNVIVRINALNTYHSILSAFISDEYSLNISNEDDEIRKETYINLSQISETNSYVEELKNITYFDKDLADLEENKTKQPNNENEISINDFSKHLEKLEKSSNYNFVSILSLTVILLITIMYSFFADRNIEISKENNIFTPGRKLSFSPDTLLSREAFKKAFEELNNGNLDKAESYFEKINDSNTKNYYLFKINMKKKNFQKAAFYFLNLSEYSADNIKEYTELVREIRKSNEINLSIEIAEKLIYFNSQEINNVLLELYAEHDIEKALLFNRFYNINNFELLKKAAEYYSQKEPQKSIEYYEKLILLSKTPEEKISYIIKADEIFLKHQNLIEKRENFILSNFDKFSHNLYLMKKTADIHIKKENYIEAQKILEEIINRDENTFKENIYHYLKTTYIIDREKGLKKYTDFKDKINIENQKKIEEFLK